MPRVMHYVIRSGDTLWMIGQHFGVSLNNLMEANPQLENSDNLVAGQIIHVPTMRAPRMDDPWRGDPWRGDPWRGDPWRGDPWRGDPWRGDPRRGDPRRIDPSDPVFIRRPFFPGFRPSPFFPIFPIFPIISPFQPFQPFF